MNAFRTSLPKLFIVISVVNQPAGTEGRRGSRYSSSFIVRNHKLGASNVLFRIDTTVGDFLQVRSSARNILPGGSNHCIGTPSGVDLRRTGLPAWWVGWILVVPNDLLATLSMRLMASALPRSSMW